MQSREDITNAIRDLLSGSTLPTVSIERGLLSDTLQTLLMLRSDLSKTEDMLDIARDDRYRDRKRQIEIVGRLSKTLMQYACECKEQCSTEHEDASYCGWAAKVGTGAANA